MVWFNESLSISPLSKEGMRNRSRLGIIDVNLLGWSQTMPDIGEAMYTNILDLAQELGLSAGREPFVWDVPWR